MGSENDWIVHYTLGNGSANLCAHIICTKAGNHAVSDVVNDRCMHVENGGRFDAQIPDAHFRCFFKHHVQYIVAVSQMMMEGNRHTALKAGLFDGFF